MPRIDWAARSPRLGVRLKRARERLRLRMTRRGLAPSASLMATLLVPEAGTAGMTTTLVESTAKAAVGFVGGESATTGMISTSVMTVTESVLRAMAFSRLKLVTYLALAAGVTATALSAGLAPAGSRIVAA